MFSKQMLVLLMLLSSVPSLAQTDDLEEAVGLEPKAREPADDASTAPTLSWLRWRGYGLVDYRLTKTSRTAAPSEHGPEGEVAIAGDTVNASAVKVFMEARMLVATEHKPQASGSAYGRLDQGGLRYRPVDSLLFVVGKERNRRAPGLIVSPSDFLHSNQNLPGMREDRNGIWLARASWQGGEQSVDLMAIPFDKESSRGLPAEDSAYAGTVARYFKRFESGFDLGIDYGRLEDQSRTGLFLQTILADVWKVYAEGGYDSLTDTDSTLLGTSFEGWPDVNLRAEWYQKDEGWNETLPLLHERSYLILSLSVMEWMDRFNLTPTLLQSLESSHHASVFRGEWLVNDQQVAGLTFLSLHPDQPLAWQASLDWKINF